MVSLVGLEFIRPPKVELKPAPKSASGWNCSWPEVVFEGSWVRVPLAAAAAMTEVAAAETETGRPETDVGTGLVKEDSEAVKRFFVYSVPSEPLLPFGDKQAGLMRFSFCLLKFEMNRLIFVS